MVDYIEISGVLLRLTWGFNDGEEDDVFIDVLMTDGGEIWKGMATHRSLDDYRKGADMEQLQHATLTRQALLSSLTVTTTTTTAAAAATDSSSSLGANSVPPSGPAAAASSSSSSSTSQKKRSGVFSSEVTGTSDALTRHLVWKCDVEDNLAGKIKILLGRIALDKCEGQRGQALMMNLLRTLVTERKEALSMRDELGEKVQEVRTQKAAMMGQLEQCLKAKEEVEERLYVKFAQILNSKKKKIRTLAKSIEKQSTVQIGSKVYGFGNKGEDLIPEGLRSAETSPKKQKIASPKKQLRQSSSQELGVIDEEMKPEAGTEGPEGSGSPRKPRNLLGSPEDPLPLSIKRNKRRALAFEEDEESSGFGGPKRQPAGPPAPTFLTPRTLRSPSMSKSRQLGPATETTQSSPLGKDQKRQKSDPSYSVSDLINNI